MIIGTATYRSNRGRLQSVLLGAFNEGVGAAAAVLASGMKRIMSRGPRGMSSPEGTPPNVQRGQLRNSMQSTPGHNLRAYAGSNVKYARIQDKGGIVRPVNARALTVPIGIRGRRASELGGARGMNLVPIRTRGGKLLLIDRNDKVPIFVLKDIVHLPARPWAMPALNANSRAMVRTFNRTARARIKTAMGVPA